MTIPEFTCKASQAEWLIRNKSSLMAQKKATDKHADGISAPLAYIMDDDKTVITKAEAIPATVSKIKVRAVINTTKLFDSHGDVHIDQLWNRSLKNHSTHYLVQEHEFKFNGIISENVHAFTKQMSWHSLGYNYEGKTQALIYDAIIDRDDMPEATKPMFDAYRKGRVKQHSVFMRYKALQLAVNDDRYAEEHAVWEKYFEEIANKEDVLENGFFWAVTEAQNIEGSAVVKGSNFATPTLYVEAKAGPSTDTLHGPPIGTLTASQLLKYYTTPKL
jgi:hypothetical protein